MTVTGQPAWLNRKKNIYHYAGAWHAGAWHPGAWHDGAWHDGAWHDGAWQLATEDTFFSTFLIFSI